MNKKIITVKEIQDFIQEVDLIHNFQPIKSRGRRGSRNINKARSSKG